MIGFMVVGSVTFRVRVRARVVVGVRLRVSVRIRARIWGRTRRHGFLDAHTRANLSYDGVDGQRAIHS